MIRIGCRETSRARHFTISFIAELCAPFDLVHDIQCESQQSRKPSQIGQSKVVYIEKISHGLERVLHISS